MNEKKLRAECKKHGLNSAGKKPDLIKRLKEFTLRYNSQIDQLKQKSGKVSSNITAIGHMFPRIG